jgi:tetratricopeptide (TPR) repeat protein
MKRDNITNDIHRTIWVKLPVIVVTVIGILIVIWGNINNNITVAIIGLIISLLKNISEIFDIFFLKKGGDNLDDINEKIRKAEGKIKKSNENLVKLYFKKIKILKNDLSITVDPIIYNYQKATTISPSFETYYPLATYCFNIGKYHLAKENYEECLKVEILPEKKAEIDNRLQNIADILSRQSPILPSA